MNKIHSMIDRFENIEKLEIFLDKIGCVSVTEMIKKQKLLDEYGDN